MEAKLYIINGDPTAAARARYGNKRVYDAQRNLKIVTGINLQNQHGDLPKYTGALHIDFVFYFALSPSWSTKKKSSMLGKPHVFKPDLDNCIKFYLDVSTGVLFANDCIIASISCRKIYDYVPKTEFRISEIKL